MRTVLEDQIILVTGASVSTANVDFAGGHSGVEAVAREGYQACFLATDVRDAEAVRHTLDLEVATWDRMMEVNLRGPSLCMKHLFLWMLNHGRGVIDNHASMAGQHGNNPFGAACITGKHGAVGLTRAAALKDADRNIRIHAICPGVIDDTAKRPEIPAERGERASQIEALYSARRLGKLPEVADMVVRLFSDATSFVTGHALPIDGSLLAQ